MNIEDIRHYVLQKEAVTEGFPFGEDTLVFKTNGKIFLLIGLDAEALSFNVKCDPEKAIEQRDQYPNNVFPGFHMNKKHWNTVLAEGLRNNFIREVIDDSYSLVASKKKK